MGKHGAGRKKQSSADKQNKKVHDGSPKSMVIRIGAGEVGTSVSQLVIDVRHVMEPDTAVRLKERRANKLRDYLTMCGPLGVSHVLLFSRSEFGNTNMRLARVPRGPTLHFRVEKYSLCKDIFKAQKHARSTKDDYGMAPLLVMNNFMTSEADREKLGEAAPPKHLEKLVTDMFQGLFPPIQPHTTPLQAIKRVLLLNREPPQEGDNGTCTITLRHYAITTKVTGLPKSLRRLRAAEKMMGTQKKRNTLPNLGALDDVADYMLDPSAAGYTSASETEMDTDAEVEVAAQVTRRVLSRREREKEVAGENGRKVMSRGKGPKVEKRAVKLIELGPRMKLRLTKVEEDIAGGKVLWHEFITKSKDAQDETAKVWAQRNKEKEERRREQKTNVEKKRKEKADLDAKSGKSSKPKPKEGEAEESSEDELVMDNDADEYDMDDDVWHDEGNEEESDEEMDDE